MSELSARSAQRYMQLAEHRDDPRLKTATVADLGLRDTCALISDRDHDDGPSERAGALLAPRDPAISEVPAPEVGIGPSAQFMLDTDWSNQQIATRLVEKFGKERAVEIGRILARQGAGDGHHGSHGNTADFICDAMLAIDPALDFRDEKAARRAFRVAEKEHGPFAMKTGPSTIFELVLAHGQVRQPHVLN
jgi:hypothetical protein